MTEEGLADSAVVVRDLSKRYISGDSYVDALKKINFEANCGELVMLIGPSGSGKTTLLSIIAGTLRGDRGEVFVLGHPIEQLTDDEVTNFRRSHIGFIFQHYHLIRSLDVLTNVTIPLILNGVGKSEAEDRAFEMLKLVNLEKKSYVNTIQLSGGEQQRVAIARALIHSPALLLCDEPTAALDAENGDQAVKLIKDLAKSKNTCSIIVTHDNRIFKYADRLVRMEDGVVIPTSR